MSLIATPSGQLYQPYTYEREVDFERDVVTMADQVFGSSTLYVDVKRRVSGKGIATIPDGYLVDMTQAKSPRLFVVENEIVKHDAFRHIGLQMLKFVTSFDESHRAVRNLVMQEISAQPGQLDRLRAGSERGGVRNIDAYLDQAVYGPFRGLVIIDEARPELHNVLEKINANISVLEFRKFVSDATHQLFCFDTLYGEFDDDPADIPVDLTAGRPTQETRARRRSRRARADTIVIPGRKDSRKCFLARTGGTQSASVRP
jgi:hypothetical protein